MAFTTAMLASEAFALIRTNVPGYKAQAQNALASMQGGSVDTNFVFRMLDQSGAIVTALDAWKAVAGLDAYATSMGYPTTMSTDCGAIASAATATINWVVANFPASGGFLLDNTLNADGSRTPRSFTSAQTAGLQTQMSSLIATIN